MKDEKIIKMVFNERCATVFVSCQARGAGSEHGSNLLLNVREYRRWMLNGAVRCPALLHGLKAQAGKDQNAVSYAPVKSLNITPRRVWRGVMGELSACSGLPAASLKELRLSIRRLPSARATSGLALSATPVFLDRSLTRFRRIIIWHTAIQLPITALINFLKHAVVKSSNC